MRESGEAPVGEKRKWGKSSYGNVIVRLGVLPEQYPDETGLFIGFIVLAGYALLGKKWYECLAGFIKGTVGYMILNVASGGLVGNFRPVLAGLKDRFELSAAVIDPYFGQAAAQASVENIGRSFSMMMMVLLIAFTMNILLVLFRKYTKIRTLFITGHVMVQQSSTALWLVLFCFPGLQDPQVVVMLGILLGTYWAVASNLTVEPVAKLTEGGGFATGHQQMFGIFLVSKIAKKIGDPKNRSKHSNCRASCPSSMRIW